MIYIVRHGQTSWNVEGRYAGRIDVDLNELGIQQAKKIHEEIKNIKFDKVFSSPLKRAYKTAQIICDNDYDIIKDERIIERCNGELEGKLKTEIKEEIDFNDPNETRLGIESIVDFRKRIKDFFEDITENYKGENILVVTHAGVSIYARCFFEGEPIDGDYSKYKLKNSEIIDNGKKLITDENCMPFKIFMGHVKYLKDKCDVIFVPRFLGTKKDNIECIKFNSIYDVTKNTCLTIFVKSN